MPQYLKAQRSTPDGLCYPAQINQICETPLTIKQWRELIPVLLSKNLTIAIRECVDEVRKAVFKAANLDEVATNNPEAKTSIDKLNQAAWAEKKTEYNIPAKPGFYMKAVDKLINEFDEIPGAFLRVLAIAAEEQNAITSWELVDMIRHSAGLGCEETEREDVIEFDADFDPVSRIEASGATMMGISWKLDQMGAPIKIQKYPFQIVGTKGLRMTYAFRLAPRDFQYELKPSPMAIRDEIHGTAMDTTRAKLGLQTKKQKQRAANQKRKRSLKRSNKPRSARTPKESVPKHLPEQRPPRVRPEIGSSRLTPMSPAPKPPTTTISVPVHVIVDEKPTGIDALRDPRRMMGHITVF